jgi:hypothetical protein
VASDTPCGSANWVYLNNRGPRVVIVGTIESPAILHLPRSRPYEGSRDHLRDCLGLQVSMHYRWHSVLYILSAVPLAVFATPRAPLWGDIRVKHTWGTAPDNWELVGPPPAGTTIDLYIARKPHCENAVIDALYEVSDPRASKARRPHHLPARACAPSLFQIWCPLTQGGGSLSLLVAPHRSCSLLASTSRHSTVLLNFEDTRWRLSG